MRWKNFLHSDIWVGIVILLLLTLPFALSSLDLSLSSIFYKQGWPWGERLPWHFLYRYGTLPGLLAGIAGLGGLLGGWIWNKLRPWQRPAAVLVLTMLLGPGLLVNAVGKGFWGRPRPRDVIQFNGTEKFCKVTEPGVPGQGKSFPCGHASAGFVLVAFYFLDPGKKRRWTWLGLGLGYGTLMGIGRMAQGGHFASDVLWAGGLTYLSAAVSHHVILPAQWPGHENVKLQPWQKWLAWTLLPISLAGLSAFFLLATPFYQAWDAEVNPAGPVKAVRLACPADAGRIEILRLPQAPLLKIHAERQGFGFPGMKMKGSIVTEQQGNTLNACLRLNLDRPATEQKGKVSVSIREDLSLWLDPGRHTK